MMIDVRWQHPDDLSTSYQQDRPVDPAPIVHAKPPAPLLMTAANPDGWKLEELLDAVRAEVLEKNKKLASEAWCQRSDSPFGGTHGLSRRRIMVRETVCELNQRITMLLMQASVLQREIQAELASLGPDQGPRGTARV